MPSRPLPTAAVEPACGAVSDGSVSPLPPDDELLDELDEEEEELEDETSAAGTEAELPPPPPPPQALSRLNKSKQDIDV